MSIHAEFPAEFEEQWQGTYNADDQWQKPMDERFGRSEQHWQPQADPCPANLAPDQPFISQDNIFAEIARVQNLLAASHRTLQDGLHLTAVNTDRDQPSLKPRDIGFFEPSNILDPFAAIRFIDCITDAVYLYGEEKTLLVGLRRCCKNDISRDWYFNLSEEERDTLRESTQAWERLIRRDFMPLKEVLLDQADAETFRWTQDRTPFAYLFQKILLLRFAGITDEDRVVRELHRGFKRCPELYLHLQHVVCEEGGNRLTDYKRAVKKFQDGARLLYEHRVSSKSSLHRCKCSNGFFGTGRKNDHPTHTRPTTPKPSECRHCRQAFPSRSRLHTHLRATGHHQRKSNRHQPAQYEIIVSTTTKTVRERFPEATTHIKQPAFFGITILPIETGASATTPLDSKEATGRDCFKNTGYEGVTFKERGYPRSPFSDRASLRSSFTTVLAASPLLLRFSSMPQETSAARRLHLRRVRRKLIHWQARPGKLKRRRAK
jgi:hypothetical protein